MSRYARGKFTVTNLDKYVGSNSPTYRSSWEFQFMRFCDKDPRILKWASEAVRIPYKDPFTGKATTYVPDFFIQYADAKGKMHVELIEVKPLNQTLLEKVGKNKNNQMQFAKNQYKWQAATIWCAKQGIKFRILTELELFVNGKIG